MRDWLNMQQILTYNLPDELDLYIAHLKEKTEGKLSNRNKLTKAEIKLIQSALDLNYLQGNLKMPYSMIVELMKKLDD